MQTATTTCSYYSPLANDGTDTFVSTAVPFQFASSTCVTVTDGSATSSLGLSAENPLYTRDDGSIVFGLALILFVLLFAVSGSLFGKKK